MGYVDALFFINNKELAMMEYQSWWGISSHIGASVIIMGPTVILWRISHYNGAISYMNGY